MQMRLRAMGLAAVMSAAVAGWGQYTPPPPPLTSAPCVPTKKEPCIVLREEPAKSPTEEFPFPGEAPAPAAKPANSATPDAPKPATDAAAKTAAEEHPFPEETSSSSSSSSSSGAARGEGGGEPSAESKADGPSLKDLGSEGTTKFDRQRLPKVVDADAREADDLTVSKFYEDRGNFRGAYLRAQDAVKTLPSDPDAHLRLAEAALKMQKKDEAIAEYKTYLKMDPKGDKAKQARNALEDIK